MSPQSLLLVIPRGNLRLRLQLPLLLPNHKSVISTEVETCFASPHAPLFLATSHCFPPLAMS